MSDAAAVNYGPIEQEFCGSCKFSETGTCDIHPVRLTTLRPVGNDVGAQCQVCGADVDREGQWCPRCTEDQRRSEEAARQGYTW